MLHMGEQASWDDQALWEAGMERPCTRTGRGRCRFDPCTIAQDIRCCAECPTRCANPCPMTKEMKL